MDPTQFNSQNWLRAVALNNARTGRTQPYGQPAAVPEANAQTAPGGLNQQQMDAMSDAASPLVVAATPDSKPEEGSPVKGPAMPGAKFPGSMVTYPAPSASSSDPPMNNLADFRRFITAPNGGMASNTKMIVTDPEAFAAGFGGGAANVQELSDADIKKKFLQEQGDKEKLDFAKQQLAQQGNLAAAGQAIQLSGQQMTAAQQAAANALAQQQMGLEKQKVEQEGQKIGLLKQQPFMQLAIDRANKGLPIPPALEKMLGGAMGNASINGQGPPLPGPGFFGDLNKTVATAPDLNKIASMAATIPAGKPIRQGHVEDLASSISANPLIANSPEALQQLAGQVLKGGHGSEGDIRMALAHNLATQGARLGLATPQTSEVKKFGKFSVRRDGKGYAVEGPGMGHYIPTHMANDFWFPKAVFESSKKKALDNASATASLIDAFNGLGEQ